MFLFFGAGVSLKICSFLLSSIKKKYIYIFFFFRLISVTLVLPGRRQSEYNQQRLGFKKIEPKHLRQHMTACFTCRDLILVIFRLQFIILNSPVRF